MKFWIKKENRLSTKQLLKHLEWIGLNFAATPTQLEIHPKIPQGDAGDRD